MAREIADSLRISLFDLRTPLSKGGGGCVYHPRNMHWTREGHEIVAAYLAHILQEREDIKNESSHSIER
jgi:hypothetical protein